MVRSRGLDVLLRVSGRGGGRGSFKCKVGDGQREHQRDESRVTWVAVCSGRKEAWRLLSLFGCMEVGSSGCSVGGADGLTDGVLLGVEVGAVEGEFDGNVLGFRL